MARSGLEKNVGGLDRLLRAAFAMAFVAIGAWALLDSRVLFGVTALLAATGLLFNVVTQFCGVNAMFGVDTCSWDGGEEAN